MQLYEADLSWQTAMCYFESWHKLQHTPAIIFPFVFRNFMK